MTFRDIILVELVKEQCNTENKKQTIYKIVLSSQSLEWQIKRTTNEFRYMIEKINEQSANCPLKFPGRGIFDPNRTKSLRVLISTILKTPSYRNLPHVRHFFMLSYIEHENYDLDKIEKLRLGELENKKAKVEDFTLLKPIGKGNFGKVYLAKSKETNEAFAIKVLQKDRLRYLQEAKHVMSERNVLVKTLKHPFLCNLRFCFQTVSKLYFVLDYVNGGELFYHLQRERTFQEPRARFYTAEIACALGYLHSENLMYRDLKPENILLDCQGHIVLTDFGLCTEVIQEGDKAPSFCGTPEYLAPEVLRKEPYDFAVDWWCLGCVLYEMLYGLPPFYSRNQHEMFRAIQTQPLKLKDTVSYPAKLILSGLLRKMKNERLGSRCGFTEIQDHPFFSGLDWEALAARRIQPPYVPTVHSQTDTQNVAKEFVREPIPDSVVLSVERRKYFKGPESVDGLFTGFSYEARKHI